MIYEDALAGVEVHEFPIHGLDRLGVPVWATAAWTADGVFCNGVGYGYDEEAARLSAWGELAESWFAHEALAALAVVEASYAELGSTALDPRRAPLPAGSEWTREQPRRWVRAQDGTLVLVELAASRHADLPTGYAPLFTPVTNGLGAGPAAREHGIRELLQRDGNSVSYRALDRGIGVNLDGLTDPVALELLARYDAAGLDVRVKLAGISCGVASVYCVGRDRDLADAPHPLALAACGEAAQPRRELAVRKALLEFAAARSRRIFNHAPFRALEGVIPAAYLDRFRSAPLRSEEHRSLRATLDWARLDARATAARLEGIHAVRETVALASLPDADAVDLAGHGMEALWVPFGALAGKAIVPSLEVESLSYARVGPRNLARLVEAGVGFAGHGPPPPGAEPLVLPEDEPAGWLDLAAMDAVVGDLYALYREPGRHVAAMAAP